MWVDNTFAKNVQCLSVHYFTKADNLEQIVELWRLPQVSM